MSGVRILTFQKIDENWLIQIHQYYTMALTWDPRVKWYFTSAIYNSTQNPQDCKVLFEIQLF